MILIYTDTRGNCVHWTNSISHGALIVPSEDCWHMK